MRSLFLVLLMACGGAAEAPAPKPAPTKAAPKPAPPPAPVKPAAPAPSGDVKAGNAEAGASVYKDNCQACHQADGTGMGGMLAADFIKEKERLAKPDKELLHSIAEGITGKKGTMPAWKETLSEQERVDALAYIHKTFGGK